jgi:hypothetical protein
LMERINTISVQLNSNIHYYSSRETIRAIRQFNSKNKGPEVSFTVFDNWNDFLILSREVGKEDFFIVISARPGNVSYHSGLADVPRHLAKYFGAYNYLLMYPDLYSDFSPTQSIEFERTGELLQQGMSQLGKTGDKLIKNILRP